MRLYKNGWEILYVGPGPYMLDGFSYSLARCTFDSRYQLRINAFRRALCFIAPLPGYKKTMRTWNK